MNCKPGDLAIGVSAVGEKVRNIGSLVRVIRSHPILPGYWEVEALNEFWASGKMFPAGTIARANDSALRPLRDEGGEDEILRIAGIQTDDRVDV